jgi:protein HIRA/HIR1
MVIAEVPLWLVHSNSSGGTTFVESIHARQGKSASVGNVALSAARDALNTFQPTLATTNNTTVASRNTKKCAIYSIDFIPNGRIFATAGGDGKVRLWNARALFASAASSSSHAADSSAAHFDAKTGAYVSSESSASDPSDDEISKNGLSKRAFPTQSQESTAVNGQDESTSEGPLTSTVQMHDLNAVVRRKKDSIPVSLKAAAASSSTNNLASTSSEAANLSSPLSPQRSPSTNGGHHQHAPHHRLLCTLSAHTGSSVLAVRFSTSGEYLASAGDDACVCIYAPNSVEPSIAATAAPVGSAASDTTPTTLEHWARIKLCRGHGLDVVDLAWAPDDSHLVSCSLDSATPIIVWKLTNLHQSSSHSKSMICNPFKVLGQSVHTSTVKGVTFDPAGSYLASSGDDPAVCIWRAHDDWGLEKRIDAESGIFRAWMGKDDDIQGLSSQSLFRRISWSTDGAFVCSTNSVVKNKHVASAISRDGWSVSGSSGQSANAANLVGHRQPVIASRHATQMLKPSASKNGEEGDDNKGDDDDDEPDYATLLALGDRRGFVTVWSTHQPKPLFKLQCSVSHCTVTDLAWGTLGNGDLVLLVSLLDGQVASLRFSVPNEIGPLLTKKEKARIFQLRYGIDLDGGDEAFSAYGQRRLFVGGHSRPKLIENPLQMSLEEDRQFGETDNADFEEPRDETSVLASSSTKDQQVESRSLAGKKRIRPVSLEVSNREKRPKASDARAKQTAQKPRASDALQNTMEAAERALFAAGTANAPRKTGQQSDSAVRTGQAEPDRGRSPLRNRERQTSMLATNIQGLAAIPHSTERVHSADLPIQTSAAFAVDGDENSVVVAECANVNKVPIGSKGSSIPCIDISLTNKGRVSWRDQIPGTSCSAVAASRQFIAVGTTDGSIQLFSTSPALGWSCGRSFRSHPPLIIGHPIVSVQFKETATPDDATTPCLDMLVVSSDGSFGVWSIIPNLRLGYKGSLMPAFLHMSLSLPNENHRFPKLARAQIAETGRLLLLLSFDSTSASRQPSHDRASSRPTQSSTDGVGGSLQAFVYDKQAELWMRMSDSRFILSDFYSAVPSSARASSHGALSKLDDTVRIGCLQSSLKDSRRSHADRHADAMYDQAEEETGNLLASRSHCEDRMACALALHSVADFKHWFGLYIRTLALRGLASQLRILIDMILGQSLTAGSPTRDGCWWLSTAPTILQEDRKSLIRSIVIPEMSKNRALQRITNEVSLQIDN